MIPGAGPDFRGAGDVQVASLLFAVDPHGLGGILLRARAGPERDLWFSDPDACCRIRKVEPLARALKPFSAWINGRKRFQGNARADIPVVEDDGARLKFNPFANVSREELEAIFTRAKLPRHPLAASGFRSVGCMPCTSRTTEGEDERAGRWRGRAKTECGIHTMKIS